MKAVAVLFDSNFCQRGFVRFLQSKRILSIEIEVDVSALLKSGLHGFHVHETGDLTEGCKTLCAHYNPEKTRHGGPRSKVRHRGDLGNILANSKGEVRQTMTTTKLKLSEIIGRSVIIHEDEDDLGRGRTEESHTTGSAGKRLLCGVIGYASVC